MTEIKWNFTVTRAGATAPALVGAFSTIDLSFPARLLEGYGKKYAPCTIRVRSSEGEIYEKDWE